MSKYTWTYDEYGNPVRIQEKSGSILGTVAKFAMVAAAVGVGAYAYTHREEVGEKLDQAKVGAGEAVDGFKEHKAEGIFSALKNAVLDGIKGFKDEGTRINNEKINHVKTEIQKTLNTTTPSSTNTNAVEKHGATTFSMPLSEALKKTPITLRTTNSGKDSGIANLLPTDAIAEVRKITNNSSVKPATPSSESTVTPLATNTEIRGSLAPALTPPAITGTNTPSQVPRR